MAAALGVSGKVFRAIYRAPGQTVALTCGKRGGTIEMLSWQATGSSASVRCEFLVQPADELGLALGPPVRVGEVRLKLRAGLSGDPHQASAPLPDSLNAVLARRCYLKLSPVA
jgi:hypothetical protein